MATYATIDDITTLWRSLTTAETTMAEQLLVLVSDELRVRADMVGKDLDEMVAADTNLASVAKSVTVDVVKRYMNDNATDTPAFTQMTESALGYSVSGTYLVPGGGLFIKNAELARLGLKRQKYGGIELC